MTIIAEVNIPKMFSAYAEDLDYLQNGRHHYQYYCKPCNQVFASAWGKIPGSLQQFELGNFFNCPNCGKRHHKHVVYVARGEARPDKMRLTVKSYKSVVTFEIRSKALVFRDYLDIIERDIKEVFRFDIANQTVTFSAYINGKNTTTMEIGDPLKLDIFTHTITRYFKSNSYSNHPYTESYEKAKINHKPELNKLLKILRETVHRKLERHLGHKISSMYVSPGQHYGLFLLPIFNIAYRVACPDAPNLPPVYRDDTRSVFDFWYNTKMLDNHDYMNEVMIHTRKKKPFVTALIEVHSLPDKPFVRRVLTEDPFIINILTTSFNLCENYDNATKMFHALYYLTHPTKHYQIHESFFRFLKIMKRIYGESGILRMVNEVRELRITDCINLYKQITRQNKKALRAEGVRLRDLHDWLSITHKRQTHENITFSVPDHIVKRLSMQTDRLSFFLPKESIELLEAGHELHNCVASYGRDMKNNSKWIVLVADDQGKLAACMEIAGKDLIQAKIDKNRSASSNTELNNAILAWAKEAKIKIKTSDVKQPTKKKTKVKVPA